MHAPCSNCPFLKKGGIRLMSGRIRDLTRGLLSNPGRTFSCHKTTTVNEDNDEGDEEGWADNVEDGPNAQHCGGALIFAEKHGHATQMMRIAERLGLYDPRKLKGHDAVFSTVDEMLKTAIDFKKPKRKKKAEPERDPCHVVDADCEAPAGWAEGGSVTSNNVGAEHDCIECGQPVCSSCSKPHPKRKGKRVCNYCTEDK